MRRATNAAAVKAAIKSVKLPERVVPLCLRGDLVATVQDLEVELEAATASAAPSLEGNPAARELAERIEVLRAEMADATVDFRLRALPRRRWTALQTEQPLQREGVEGISPEFFDQLIRESIVEPVLDRVEVDELLDALSHGQWDQLASAAWRLNTNSVDIPFSFAASQILRTSGGESKQPNGSESPSGDSTAGSLGE